MRERLLHVLHLPALALQQHAALTPQRTQGAYGIRRTERTAEQTVGHELLQSLAVEHIRLATGDILDVAGIDQQDGEAT